MTPIIRTPNGEFFVEPKHRGYRISRANLPTIEVNSDEEVFTALQSHIGELELLEHHTGDSIFLSTVEHDSRGKIRGTFVKDGAWTGVDVLFASLHQAIMACLTGDARSYGILL